MAFTKPSFNLPFGIYIGVADPIDQRYGPYTSLHDPMIVGDVFHENSPVFGKGTRHMGLTVGIILYNEIVEHWFKDGVENSDLVIKSSSGSIGTVISVNQKLPDFNGNVQITKNDIGLGNVDNTTDINKPVSIATQIAIDDALSSVITLQGNWNANTNTPDISGTTTTGYAWVISVAGSTDLGGITNWEIGDLAVKTDTGWLKTVAANVVSKWGSITGVLTDQLDLKNALDNKENDLGYPANEAMMLVSSILGKRSWVTPPQPGGVDTDKYIPLVPSTMKTPEKHGGIPKGVTAASLTNKTISQMLDLILFPTVEAYIKTNIGLIFKVYDDVSVSLIPSGDTREIGTQLLMNTTSLFDRGAIQNGDDTPGPSVSGSVTKYELLMNNTPVEENLSGIHYISYILRVGIIQWSGRAEYEEGTGEYHDGAGDPATNLDADRVAGVITSFPFTIYGVYRVFSDIFDIVGELPSDSDGVRALHTTMLLNHNNTGVMKLFVPANKKVQVIVIPAQNDMIVMQKNGVDITDAFKLNQSTIQVEDATGTASYPYSMFYIDTVGYSTDEEFTITIV